SHVCVGPTDCVPAPRSLCSGRSGRGRQNFAASALRVQKLRASSSSAGRRLLAIAERPLVWGKRSAPRGRLSSPPPILFGFPLHRWHIRVFELEPILRSAGSVARSEPLRDDAFEAHLAGLPEYALTIVGEVLVQDAAPEFSAVYKLRPSRPLAISP